MEKVKNLRSLLIAQIKKLHNAEKQQQMAFHGFVKKLKDEDLKKLVSDETDGIEEEIRRLEKALNKLGVTSFTGSSEVMEHLIKETTDLLESSEADEVSDAAQIMALQQIKHYEIAAYGTICSYAKTLGEDDVAELLHQNLDDEKEADDQLTELAEKKVNERAKAPVEA